MKSFPFLKFLNFIFHVCICLHFIHAFQVPDIKAVKVHDAFLSKHLRLNHLSLRSFKSDRPSSKRENDWEDFSLLVHHFSEFQEISFYTQEFKKNSSEALAFSFKSSLARGPPSPELIIS